jgi:hypothetical protein
VCNDWRDNRDFRRAFLGKAWQGSGAFVVPFIHSRPRRGSSFLSGHQKGESKKIQCLKYDEKVDRAIYAQFRAQRVTASSSSSHPAAAAKLMETRLSCATAEVRSPVMRSPLVPAAMCA